jgi:hypothetical protein
VDGFEVFVGELEMGLGFVAMGIWLNGVWSSSVYVV